MHRRRFSALPSDNDSSTQLPTTINSLQSTTRNSAPSYEAEAEEEPKTLIDPPDIDLNKFGFYEITETEGTGDDKDGYCSLLAIHGPRETWIGGGGDPRSAQGGVFAAIIIGPRQFKVGPGDVLYTDRIPGEVNSEYVFDKVLLIGTLKWSIFGRPLIPNARVKATIEEQTRSRKTYTFKFKKRKGYRRKLGHRQPLTRFRINDIDYTLPQDRARYVDFEPPYDPTMPPQPNIQPVF